MNILNVAAGKLRPLDMPDKYFLVNIDQAYYSKLGPAAIEEYYFNREARHEKEYNQSFRCFG